jgi:hypothetical protein
MDCRHSVFIVTGGSLRLVMTTDMCLEDILEAVNYRYDGYQVVINDNLTNQEVFRTR